jgi:branched-chain amino acid transport system ATP-binding protein
MAPALFRVSHLCKKFGNNTVVDDLSLEIGAGECLGVIGPNGAGKTTLFNIVSGIYSLTSGSIFLEEKNISGFAPETLATLGLVRTFQNVELFGQMSVLENVMVGLHTRSRSGIVSCAFRLPGQVREEKRIRELGMKWLEFVGMTDSADLTAASLPFGKGRLLEIARALAVEPRIILMDEPAAGLNSRETIGLAALIKRIRLSGITVILVEHDTFATGSSY